MEIAKRPSGCWRASRLGQKSPVWNSPQKPTSIHIGNPERLHWKSRDGCPKAMAETGAPVKKLLPDFFLSLFILYRLQADWWVPATARVGLPSSMFLSATPKVMLN